MKVLIGNFKGKDAEIDLAFDKQSSNAIANSVVTEAVDQLNSNLDTLSYGENSGGANLFDKSKIVRGAAIGSGGSPYDNGSFGYSDYIHVEPNTEYTFMNVDWFNYYDANKSHISQSSGGTSTTPSNAKYVIVSFRLSFVNSAMVAKFHQTEYVSYVMSNKQLTQANESLSDVEFLGWSVPKECPIKNNVDSDGVFHQRVDRVDLGSLDWQYETGLNRFVALIPGKFKPSDQSAEWARGIYCVLYEADTSPIGGSNVNMTISGYTNTAKLYLYNFSYTDATTFKNAMQGVYLYYELEEEKTISVDGNEAVARIKNDLDTLEFGEIAGGKNLFKEYVDMNGYSISNEKYNGYPVIYRKGSWDGAKANTILKAGKTYAVTVYSKGTGQIALYGSTSFTAPARTITSDWIRHGWVISVTSDTNELRVENVSDSGETYIACMQIEEGTTATPYEPYIPSVKMLADEVSEQNESLEGQGLLNKFDGELLQGAYVSSNGSYDSTITTSVCTKNKIDVVAGDRISARCNNKVVLYTNFRFYKTDGTFISGSNATNGLSVVVPANATKCSINFATESEAITPSTVGNISIYINNSIDSLKNDLGGLKFSASGTTLTITDGTNTWTLSK